MHIYFAMVCVCGGQTITCWSPLFLPCGSWGFNLDYQAWWQVPLSPFWTIVLACLDNFELLFFLLINRARQKVYCKSIYLLATWQTGNQKLDLCFTWGFIVNPMLWLQLRQQRILTKGREFLWGNMPAMKTKSLSVMLTGSHSSQQAFCFACWVVAGFKFWER